ncbi:MAG: 4Fe-4S binding protein [Candidatus Omnitrophica bacterium]|nr:4Fe-4S binding protein [Candidatus Omnitrophota bacterium]
MGKIKIDKERCKGCGLCIIQCSKHLIALSGPVNKLGIKTAKTIKAKGSNACSGCGICAIMCPDCAIEVWR